MELIVIAAGRGSRFTKAGIFQPKPLVLFREKPLFWWATESALSSGSFSKIHFAVLREHIEAHAIDKEILAFYHYACLHIIDQVTSGAAETAAIVASQLATNLSIAFVDCDVAFAFERPLPFSPLISFENSAALCLFKSNNPAFSYALFNCAGELTGTVEKVVASDWAICGLYGFQSASLYLEYFSEYEKNCSYSELFLSGIINAIAANEGKILPVFLSEHKSLGTPEDIADANKISRGSLPAWHKA
jgi:dTDP-glucose pyrophosphorylase